MHTRVVSTTQLTPGMIRVVLGGDDLAGFAMPDSTDAYVNLALPPAGAPYDEVFDPRAVRDEHPRETWPVRRRYTVRAWDPAAQQLTIDFVVHGDRGVAGPWAARAEPGDVLVLEGPSGGYRPDPEADWHLLVGDESALPAIAASLEALPAGARAVVRLICDSAEHEQPLATEADLDLVWVHRDRPDALLDSVRTLDAPAGRAHAFVHGEADEIRAIRAHLLGERGLTRQQMSCSPYWRHDMDDEAWREVKRDFVAAMDADLDPA
ncbi:siderophore-interacting protein [Nocardioides aurantiacus]|uniref:siderophore-interacting protein n=1 Tax=Nocardioides aurantiacus TaxID=86796 RepID=UPI00403FB02F